MVVPQLLKRCCVRYRGLVAVPPVARLFRCSYASSACHRPHPWRTGSSLSGTISSSLCTSVAAASRTAQRGSCGHFPPGVQSRWWWCNGGNLSTVPQTCPPPLFSSRAFAAEKKVSNKGCNSISDDDDDDNDEGHDDDDVHSVEGVDSSVPCPASDLIESRDEGVVEAVAAGVLFGGDHGGVHRLWGVTAVASQENPPSGHHHEQQQQVVAGGSAKRDYVVTKSVLQDSPLRDRLVEQLERYGLALRVMESPPDTGAPDAKRDAARELGELSAVASSFMAFADVMRQAVDLVELWEDLDGEAILARGDTDGDSVEMAVSVQEEMAALRPAAMRLHNAVVGTLVPADDEDDADALMELHAAAGGSEAGLFAAELLAMYGKLVRQYGAERGFRATVTKCMRVDGSGSGGVATTPAGSASDGLAADGGGGGGGSLPAAGELPDGAVRSATLIVRGRGAYAWLRSEAGVHRVQRVPKTETQGRVHTSTVSVAVFPSAGHDANSAAAAALKGSRRKRFREVPPVDPSEVRVDVYRASGPGGQHVNKTSSAVRLTHLPSGLVVTSQDDRSQIRNKASAMRVLAERLYARKGEAYRAARAKEKNEMVGSGQRSHRIRTYNWAQDRVTDHRVPSQEGGTVYGMDAVMAGRSILLGLVDTLSAMRKQDRLEFLLSGRS